MIRSTLAVLLTVAMTFIGVTAIAVAVTSQSSDQSSSPQQPPSPRTKAESADPRLAKSVRAFRRERRADDALTPDGERLLEAASELGTNVKLARKAKKAGDGRTYFLVPGNDSVALVNEQGLGAIDDIDHALSGQSLGVEDCAGDQIRLIGMLPDEVADARVVLSDGSVRQLDVEGNVYVELFDKTPATLPQRVEFELNGALQQVRVPVPADILTTRCGPPTP